MPTIRGSYRRLDAPSDIYLLEMSYQLGSPVTWVAIVTGGSIEIESMRGQLDVEDESKFFVREQVISEVRSQVALAIEKRKAVGPISSS